MGRSQKQKANRKASRATETSRAAMDAAVARLNGAKAPGAAASASLRGEAFQSQSEWEAEQKERLAALFAPRPVRKVALMGISGYPPHIGHALAAEKLAETYDLVLVSPADGNPFKPHLPALPGRLHQTENIIREALADNPRVKVRSIGGLVAQAKRAAGEENPQAFTIEELEWVRREGEILGEIWEAKAAFGPDVLQAGSFDRFKEAGRILAEFGVEKMPDNGCPRSSQLRAAMASVERWGAKEFLALAGRVGRSNALEYLSTGEFLRPGCEIDAEAIAEVFETSVLNKNPRLDEALFGPQDAEPEAPAAVLSAEPEGKKLRLAR